MAPAYCIGHRHEKTHVHNYLAGVRVASNAKPGGITHTCLQMALTVALLAQATRAAGIERPSMATSSRTNQERLFQSQHVFAFQRFGRVQLRAVRPDHPRTRASLGTRTRATSTVAVRCEKWLAESRPGPKTLHARLSDEVNSERQREPEAGNLSAQGHLEGGSTRHGFLSHLGSSTLRIATVWAAAGAVTATGHPQMTFADSTGRSIEDIKKGVEADFLKGRYYVTGDLTPSLYRPDCLFTDPTTRVGSVDKYTNAVKLLFDPENAQVDLLSLEVEDDCHLFAKWRLQGYLKFPWHPYVAPYTGTTRYSVDSDGLIYSHEETWSISALDAVKATITPTAGPTAKNLGA